MTQDKITQWVALKFNWAGGIPTWEVVLIVIIAIGLWLGILYFLIKLNNNLLG